MGLRAAPFIDGCGEAGEAQGIPQGAKFVATSSDLACKGQKRLLRDATQLIWSKVGQGLNLVKKVEISKVLRMGLPIVENLSGLEESILSLSRSPQLNSPKNSQNRSTVY